MALEINLDELRNLDLENIGNWPAAFKGVAIALLCAGVLLLGYLLDTKDQLLLLESVRKQEDVLKEQFIKEQSKAVNLVFYKRQMEEMEESFGTMLRQLPSRTEVANLLVDITQTGLASGLEFELFKPEPEQPKDFYAELPITITVTGNYHQFGEFVSGVAALPRIVTMHDISLQRLPNSSELSMEATAKTYRYLDEEEQAAVAARKKQEAAAKRRR